MRRRSTWFVALGAALGLALTGCGNSSGRAAPTASAGQDAVAYKGEVVTLDGRASAGAPGAALTFTWRQLTGTPVALSDSGAPLPTFTAPRATGPLRFGLVARDGATASAEDEVVVEVRNRTPVAEPGRTLLATPGEVVGLTATASSDPDGDPLTATWYQRSGPPVTLTVQPGGAATFQAPVQPVVLIFGLVVDDGEAVSAEATQTVEVLAPSQNWPPEVSAGSDLQPARRSTVALYAYAYDRDGDTLTWTWTQTAGPAVVLQSADGPGPRFQAPAEEADLEFLVAASDGRTTSTDRVAVRVRNQAPALSEVLLRPLAPVATDRLTAEVTSLDADQDPVTLSFVWRRNGVLLSGQTGASLEPGLAVRGDVVAVTVVASDGALQATAEGTVTVGDAPPVFDVSAPASVPWGQAMSFTVTARDPDGDPAARIELRYGPAGMTVSPAGAGAWTPTLPLFGPSLDLHYAVGVIGDTSASEDRVIRVTDAGREEPIRRSGPSAPSSPGGLAVADLHGDGRSGLLVAGVDGLYELAPQGGGYAQAWAMPFSTRGTLLTAVVARDLDGDRSPEIILASTSWYSLGDAELVLLDGRTRQRRASATTSCRALAVADVGPASSPELLCLSGANVFDGATELLGLDPATLEVRWKVTGSALGRGLAVGDVDGDGALEVVTSSGLVLDGRTHAAKWASTIAFGNAVATGDVDGDGVDEIVGLEGTRARGFSAVLRSPVWEITSDASAMVLADLDHDGRAEVVLGGWGGVWGWSYRPATKGLEQVLHMNTSDYGVSAIAAGDLDGDGEVELAWGAGTSGGGPTVMVVGRPAGGGTVAWSPSAEERLGGRFLGARLARTTAGGPPGLFFEVSPASAGWSGTRLARLDPATGGVQASAQIGNDWSGLGALDAFDANGDGVDELYLSSADYYAGFLAGWDFGRAAETWRASASTGPVVGLTHADVNGDAAPDLVALTTDGYLELFDVLSGTLIWKSTGLGTAADVAAADLDGDGTPELVALAGGRLVIYRPSAGGPDLWLEAASVAEVGFSLVVADCDGDGALEIHVLGDRVLRRYDADLVLQGLATLALPAAALSVEDVSPGRKNLVVWRGVEDYGLTAQRWLEAIDPVSGAVIWSTPRLHGEVQRHSLTYLDLPGSGRRALAFGTSSGMYVTR